MKKPAFLFLLSTFLLTSCGFEPMYGSHAPAVDENPAKAQAETSLGSVGFGVIETQENEDARYGQILRNELIDRFYHNGTPSSPRYTLHFTKLNVNVRELDLTKSSEVTRSQIVANTTIQLTDNDTGQLLLARTVSSISSYNILSSKFATRVTEDNARTSALKDLARQIELQLTLYFNRDPALAKDVLDPAKKN